MIRVSKGENVATRKSDADGRGSARYRGRSSLGEASDIDYRGGLPLGTSNFCVGSQAVGASGDPLAVSRSGFPLGSSNEAADRQSGLYRSPATTSRIKSDPGSPRSDGVAFDFKT